MYIRYSFAQSSLPFLNKLIQTQISEIGHNHNIIIIIISTIIGEIGGLNQTSIRKILTYPSINHTGWMLTKSENLWIVYFKIYSTLSLTVVSAIKLSGVSFINQTIITNKETKLIKFTIFTSLLSWGGLPPFLGFLPKCNVMDIPHSSFGHLTRTIRWNWPLRFSSVTTTVTSHHYFSI